jgi:probable HAF family extracellular repeat protein
MPTERWNLDWRAAAGLLIGLGFLAACPAIPVSESESIKEVPAFVIQELGLLAGGATSQAFGVNAGGFAVGFATDAGGVRHAVYFQGGVAVQLPEPANTTRSDAFAVNDAGVIVGSVRIAGVEQPARWDTPTSQPVMLELPVGITVGRARSINADGEVAGFVTSDELPVLWDAAGAVTVVDPSLTDSHEPTQINNDGDFVGNAEEIEAGFIWTDEDGFTFLGSLSGEADDDEPGESEGRGINNNGVVVGSSETADHLTRAFRWTEARGIVRLGEPVTGDDGAAANAVNDVGLVAGFSFTGTIDAIVTSQPVVTLVTGEAPQFTALPTLDGDRAEPTGGGSINNCGVIVGWAFPNGSTSRHAVAWLPADCSVQ